MGDSPAKKSLSLLLLGVESVWRDALRGELDPKSVLERPLDLEKIMEELIVPAPGLILVGPPPPEVNLNELAQVLRAQFQLQPILFFTSVRVGYDPKAIRKNGFNETFLFPSDLSAATQFIQQSLIEAGSEGKKIYRPVSLIDILPGQSMDFDTYVYMPVNRKHIRLSVAGDSLDEGRVEKLAKGNVSSVSVSLDQMSKFYEFSGRQLRTLQEGKGMSETERKARMTTAVRSLLTQVFSQAKDGATVDEGRSIVGDCQEIVKNFIVGPDAKNNWFAKIVGILGGESGVYNHAGNVATFAALFSLVSEVGKPEDLGLAGLLHDMGLADLPSEVQLKSEEEMTPEETALYQSHVGLTLKLIQERKIILNSNVLKAIEQHHERWSGTGYPKGLAGARISKEAQILSLASLFDEITIGRDGRPRMSPAAAFTQILAEDASNPSNARFDPDLIAKFMRAFPTEEGGGQ